MKTAKEFMQTKSELVLVLAWFSSGICLSTINCFFFPTILNAEEE